MNQPWTLWCLRGDEAALVDTKALQWRKPLAQAFDGAFATLPEPFASCSDGLIRLSHGSTLFLAGDQCLEQDWGKKILYRGPITGYPGLGAHIPAAFRSDLDIAVQLPALYDTRRTLLIKGDQCAVIMWGQGVGYQGPLSGMEGAGWKRLPKDMSGDFDHAIMCFPGGGYRTLFIKGDKAMDLDWGQGPIAVGTWAEVLPGLAALPADFQKPRLPAAGRFIGTTEDGGSKIDLRVDLVGALPVISGDIFDITANGEEYSNSFVLEGTAPLALPGTLEGTATYAEETMRPRLSVTVGKLAPGGTATVTRSNPDDEDVEPYVYTCAYVSRFLRTIDWEIDYIAGTTPVGQYATTDHPRPPGLDKRVMTVQAAFADAGVELRTGGAANEVALSEADKDLMWSTAELHAAMSRHFSLHRDTQQWKLWTFIANRKANNDGTPSRADGTMFDSNGTFQRQGMATFYDVMQEVEIVGTRDELFTFIHEIGHALNLAHTFGKDSTIPPQPMGPRDGYGDKSFMNYQDDYQGDPATGEGDGGAAFWSVFAWQFTPGELRHMRHGFYADVVMGGKPFMTGAAHLPALPPPAPTQSGLRLRLSGSESFSHGEPVTVEIKLSLDGSRPAAEAVDDLTPAGSHLTVLITDPAGQVRPFQPIARDCGNHHRLTLDAGTPALYAGAYLGYGAGGFTFPEPGTYRLQARYRAPDGSTVVSPEHLITVKAPADDTDRAVGDLLLGDQQGILLALRGSDAPQLADGNAALDTLIADHPDHPLAVHARMAKGANAGRNFLTLTESGVEVRTADTDTSIEQLAAVVETTLDPTTDAGVDNITLNETMRRLARAHARAGDLTEADTVLDQLVETFRDKDVPKPVLATIVEQAEAARTELHDQA
ncbi:M12 family metallo-peptidase [Streptosporangium sp. DT93]|uniref:M12 family metallo-peptidase n=1 Tax=Streptosporangium sp. DT93 TaxID=3393428 RepID=UPI003CFAE37E